MRQRFCLLLSETTHEKKLQNKAKKKLFSVGLSFQLIKFFSIIFTFQAISAMIAAMEEPKIIFEDDQVAVLDKPAGITVNRSDTTTGERTLQDWADSKFKIQSAKLKVNKEKNLEYTDPEYYQKVFQERSGIVHRLDRETSGIIIVAKTPEAFQNLQQQFKERTVKKTYLGLAHGEIKPSEGEINAPIGRLPWNRRHFGVIAGGREAVTKYKLLSVFSSQLSDRGQSVNQSFSHQNRQAGKLKNQIPKTENRKPITEHYSLVELYPETGRTHQIRVHLKHINHPIVADFLYAGRKTARNDRKDLSRVFLHAFKISFNHPTTGKRIELESPLPQVLGEFLEKKCLVNN